MTAHLLRRVRRTVLLVVSAGALLAGCGSDAPDGEPAAEVGTVAPGEEFLATLCFPSDRSELRCDEYPIQAAVSAEETAAVIVRALIAGPASRATVSEEAARPEGDEALHSSLPDSVRLLELEINRGVAYVDLTVEQLDRDGEPTAGGVANPVLGRDGPPMGLQDELLAVYSVVNSLVLNDLGVERVVFLWNGEQRPTFSGHVDTTRPLMADLERNAESTAGDA